MTNPKRVRRTLQAREARLKEIDSEVARILAERQPKPPGEPATDQASSQRPLNSSA